MSKPAPTRRARWRRIVEQGIPFSRSQIALFEGNTTIWAFSPSASFGKKLRRPCRTVKSRSEIPNVACALDSSRKSSHLFTGLPETEPSGRSTRRKWACEIGRINGEIGVYSMMSFTKAKFPWPANRFALAGKGPNRYTQKCEN